MAPMPVELNNEFVVAAPFAATLRNSFASAQHACERQMALTSVSMAAQPALERQGLRARWETQVELAANGIEVGLG